MGGGDTTDYVTIEGRAPVPKEQQPLTEYCVVMPNYFKAMGIPLLAGRDVAEADTKQSPNVAIISQEFARLHFPSEDPLGHRILLQGQQRDPLVIVGVVGDVKQLGLDEKVRATVYAPYLQDPLGSELPRSILFVIRSSSDPAAMAATIRSEALAVDNGLPIFSLKTMTDYLSESLSRRRFNMTLLSVFAAVALLLAAIGIYGVISYSVTQRTHEIGIRMALGARPASILRMVVGKGMGLVFVGIAVGLVTSYLLTSFVQSLLYEVSATDPIIFAVIPLLVVGVALGASFVPAQRATRVDPMIALRYE
jgi:predicted permease